MGNLTTNAVELLIRYWYLIVIGIIFFNKTLLYIIIFPFAKALVIANVSIRKTDRDFLKIRDLDDKFILWTFRIVFLLLSIIIGVAVHEGATGTTPNTKSVEAQEQAAKAIDRNIVKSAIISGESTELSDKFIKVKLNSADVSDKDINISGSAIILNESSVLSESKVKIAIYDEKGNKLCYVNTIIEHTLQNDEKEIKFTALRENPSGDRNTKYTYKIESINTN